MVHKTFSPSFVAKQYALGIWSNLVICKICNWPDLPCLIRHGRLIHLSWLHYIHERLPKQQRQRCSPYFVRPEKKAVHSSPNPSPTLIVIGYIILLNIHNRLGQTCSPYFVRPEKKEGVYSLALALTPNPSHNLIGKLVRCFPHERIVVRPVNEFNCFCGEG